MCTYIVQKAIKISLEVHDWVIILNLYIVGCERQEQLKFFYIYIKIVYR